jgi:hypothetical protein
MDQVPTVPIGVETPSRLTSSKKRQLSASFADHRLVRVSLAEINEWIGALNVELAHLSVVRSFGAVGGVD